MINFKNGPLASWKQIAPGDVIEFKSNKPRHVRFQLTANSPVEIWAGSDPAMSDAVLIGATDQKCQIEFTSNGTSFVMIKAEKKSAVYINAPDFNQSVKQSEKPSFTSIEPRIKKNTEFDRMMQMMRLNEEQRNRELAAERAELRAKIAELGAPAKQPQEAVEDLIEPEKEVSADDAPTTT
jgi:hypothetical protein